MNKLFLLLFIPVVCFGQLDTNKQTIKVEFVGKAARMGPFLKKPLILKHTSYHTIISKL